MIRQLFVVALALLILPASIWADITAHIAWYRGGSTLTNSGSTYQEANIETAFDALGVSHGYTWAEVDTAQDVINGALVNLDGTSKYAVVYFMGGSGTAYNSGLGVDGKAAIQAFVDAGGGYVGSCAGAFYGSDNYTDLWAGDANPDASILRVDYVLDTGHALNSGMGEVLEDVQFYGGCWLEEGVANTDYVAEYDTTDTGLNGHPSMTFSYYGDGPVLLSGGHPEEGLGVGDLDYFKQMFIYVVGLGAYEDTPIPTVSGCTITGGQTQ